MASASIGNVDVVKLRIDFLNGTFDLEDDTKAFMNMARSEMETAARKIDQGRPKEFDYGRWVAAVDAMQHAKNLFCDSAIIGGEHEKRKKCQ